MHFNYEKTVRSWLTDGSAAFTQSAINNRQLTYLTELIKGMYVINDSDKIKKNKALSLLENIRHNLNELIEQKAVLEEQIEILEERL